MAALDFNWQNQIRIFLNLPWVRVAGLSAGSAVLGLILLLFVAIPGFARILELQGKISTEDARLAILKEKVVKLSDLDKQTDTLKSEFGLFEKAITTESKVPELLTQIQTVSTISGVRITSLQFSGETEGMKGTLREVRLRYGSEGTLTNLSNLLKNFEDSSRVVDLESLRYHLRIDQTTGLSLIETEAILLAFYTPEPILVPENQVTFSLSDPDYIIRSEFTQTLTQY